jgi:hypothetical protein
MKKICTVILVLIAAKHSNSQVKDSSLRHHELGIDVANALTFIKKNTQSYLLNYRYLLNQKISLRAGLNLDLSNEESGGKYPDLKCGILINNRREKWNLYYGADFSWSYFKSNAIPIVTTRVGASPLLGVQYFAGRRISISTEASMNYYHFTVTNHNTFDPEKEKSYYRIFIGSVGMVLISYHF